MASGVTIIIAGKDDTGAVFKQIEENLNRIHDRAGETESALESLGERGKQALEAIGISLAAREIVRGLEEVVEKSLEFGEAIERANAKTGLAVGTLSTLHYAADVTGGDFDGMAEAVAKLDKTIGTATEGNKKSQAFLASLGLSATDLASRSDGAEIAFRKFTQTIAATESPIRRVELATGLLGKAGADQIPTLLEVGNNWEEFRKRAEAAGVQLNGETASQLQATNQKLADMKERVMGAGLAFTEGLTPGLSQFFDVLSGGNGAADVFVGLGERLAAVLNLGAAAAYGFASGLSRIEAFSEGGSLTALGRDSLAISDRLDAESRKFLEAIALGNKTSPTIEHPDIKPSGDFGGIGDPENASKMRAAQEKAAQAARQLAQANDKLDAARAKAASDLEITAANADHQQLLITDEEFYRQKEAAQAKALDAERDAVVKQQGDIQTQIGKLQAEKVSGPEAVDRDAKVTELRAKIVDLQAQSVALGAKEIANSEALNVALGEAAKKRLEEADALGVAAETARGGSTSARVKQSHDAYYGPLGARQRVLTDTPDAINAADTTQQHAEDSIAASGASEDYGRVSGDIGAKRSSVDAQVARGTMSSVTAQRQKIALDKEEAAAMEPVIAAYQKLADAGDLNAAEKVTELQEKMEELKNPVDEVAAHIREQFGSAFESLFENLDRGKKALDDFAKQIEKMVVTQTYKSFIEPEIQSGLGKIIPNRNAAPAAAGQPSSVAKGVGAIAGLIPGLAGKLPGIAPKAGTSGGVSVTLINQGAPMEVAGTSQQSKQEQDFETRTINIVLKNLFTNGSIAQALSKV